MSEGNSRNNDLRSSLNGDMMRTVFSDRPRTNLLKKHEQKALIWLVQRIPSFITSNMLTGIGFCGNVIVAASFILASYFSRSYLLFGILGFLIAWFGDSLDGRIAYYRKKPRKKYGFTLDITIDWISIIVIGLGYTVYAEGIWELFGYGFVVMYGWEIIITLVRYKIAGKYSIDSGKIGPTEVRIIICMIMVAEVLLPGSLTYLAGLAVIILFVVNIMDTKHLLYVADVIDKQELNEKT